MAHSIHHDLVIKAPIDIVFEAVSDSKHLVNWWPLRCKGKPNKGEVYNFFFTPEYDWYGKVARSEKNKSFHIKLTNSDPDWDTTSFGFDLEEKGENVQVQFWHIGWPECNAHFRRSSYCWAILLNGLKNYVKEGIIIPFEKRE